MNENYPYHTRLPQPRCSHKYTNVGVCKILHVVIYCIWGPATQKRVTTYNILYITVLKSKMSRDTFERKVLEKAFKSKEELDAFVQEAGKEVSMKSSHMRDTDISSAQRILQTKLH